MPLKSLNIPPGVSKESTELSSAGRWYDSNNMRWSDMFPETIGGWTSSSEASLLGTTRGLHAWKDFSGSDYLAAITSSKAYLVNGDLAYDITPIRLTFTSAGGIFSIEASATEVLVDHVSHGASVGDYVVVTAMASNLDVIPAADFIAVEEGFYITSVIDADSYTFEAPGTAAAQDLLGGGVVTLEYKIASGGTTSIGGRGWGAGTYGSAGLLPTVFNLDPTNAIISPNGTSGMQVNLAGGSTIVAGDWLYLYDIVGSNSNGSHSAGMFNNKWFKVISVSIGFANVETGYISTAIGVWGGANGKYLEWTLASGEVTGLSGRGYNEPDSDLLITTTARTVSLTNFGEDLMFANRGGPLYYYDVSQKTSVGVPLSGQAAVEIGTISGSSDTPDIVDSFVVAENHGHTIVFGTNDIGASTQDKMLIRWSDRHNPFSWTPAPDNEAGAEILRHGSEILTGITTRDEIVIFTNSAVYSMRYIGSPEIYGVTLKSRSVNLFSRGGAVNVDGNVFFMANGQFYVYDGGLTPLPKDVSSYVFGRMNFGERDKIVTGVNSKFTEVIWFYPSTESDENDSYVSFNYTNGSWGLGSYDMTATRLNRTAWIDSIIGTNPTTSYIDQVDATAVPPVLTSRLFFQESGTSANGLDINYSLTSGDVDLEDGQVYLHYSRLIPDVRFFSQDTDSPDISIVYNISSRGLPGRVLAQSSSVTVNSIGSVDDAGVSYIPNYNDTAVRGRGRSVRLEISSTSSGSLWRLGTTRIDAQADGGGR